MRLAGLETRRLVPMLFDIRWSKPESGRGTLSGSCLVSRRPRSGPLAPGTGVRAAAPPFPYPSLTKCQPIRGAPYGPVTFPVTTSEKGCGPFGTLKERTVTV